jgi:hypothetical protein
MTAAGDYDYVLWMPRTWVHKEWQKTKDPTNLPLGKKGTYRCTAYAHPHPDGPTVYCGIIRVLKDVEQPD